MVGERLYVDPPQLVTAGMELAIAGIRFDDLRAYADAQPAKAVRNSGADFNALSAFHVSWQQYTDSLRGLAQVIARAGALTAQAAQEYRQVDMESARRMLGSLPT